MSKNSNKITKEKKTIMVYLYYIELKWYRFIRAENSKHISPGTYPSVNAYERNICI